MANNQSRKAAVTATKARKAPKAAAAEPVAPSAEPVAPQPAAPTSTVLYTVKADAKTKPNTFGALVAKLTAEPVTLAQVIAGITAEQATAARKPVPLSAKNPDTVIRVRAKHFLKALCNTL